MKNHIITLNFLPLKSSDFTFDVFRKKVKPNEKKWDKKVRYYKLPDENGKYIPYWVSFYPLKDAELFSCKASTNIDLTKEYLKYLLIKRSNEEHIKLHQYSKKFEQKRVYFLIEKIKDKNQKVIGDRTIWLEPYFLKNRKAFGFLINYKFIKSDKYPFNKEVLKHSLSLNDDYQSNLNYYIDKYTYLFNFIDTFLPKIKYLTNAIEISSSFQELKSSFLKIKQYLFSNNQQMNSQFRGIMEFGPYQEINESPFYFYIFKPEHRPYALDLLQALNGDSFITFKGLSTFKLPNQNKYNTKAFYIKEYSDTELDKIFSKILETKKLNPIIIIVLPKKEERFYIKLKNKCLKFNIPSQVVHIETINNNLQLKWSVGSIALQIFSKLGGVPWIVTPSNKNTLIVGIGQSHKYDEETKKILRFYSYSVLLDSSGKFLEIKQLADEQDKHAFLKSLAYNIKEIVRNYQNYEKIVFHVSEKINKNDIKTIENALRTIDNNIELSIIKINDNPKFFGFNKNENSLVPYESSYIQLSNNEFLLWTEGLNLHSKKVYKRYGNPLHITFHYSNKEEFYNFHEKYLQDILNLSGANYRGFNAKAFPVSIFYPKLISKFSKYFKELNLDFVTTNTTKPWFL